MSIEVSVFDTKKAEYELMECSTIVKSYVDKIKINSENWKNITQEAIRKLRETAKELNEYKKQKNQDEVFTNQLKY